MRERQTDRQTDRQAETQTDRQTDRAISQGCTMMFSVVPIPDNFVMILDRVQVPLDYGAFRDAYQRKSMQ